MIRIHNNSSLANGLRKSPVKNSGEQQNRHQSIQTSWKKEVLKRTHPQEDCQQLQRRGLDLNSNRQGRGRVKVLGVYGVGKKREMKLIAAR